MRHLEDGDAELRALWQRVCDRSWSERQEINDLLATRYDEVRGESAYEASISGLIKMLEERGLGLLGLSRPPR